MTTESHLSLPAHAKALQLLISIYQFPSLTVKESSDNEAKLVDEKGEEVTGENTIAFVLGSKLDKVHWTPELRAEAWEWLTRSQNFTTSPEEVYDFDTFMAARRLALRTFDVTWLDYILYARIHPVVKAWTKEQSWQHPAIFRFVNYIQHKDSITNLTSHERAEFPAIPLSQLNEIPDAYKVDRHLRPINSLPVVARSASAVDAVTKSLAATSLTTDPQTGEPAVPPPKKDKKAEKAAKKEKDPKPPKAAKVAENPPNPGMIDLRVGQIQKAEKHPDADSLYVSHIDVGEDKVRVVCSGLVKYIPIEEMQKRMVVCVCNLKEVKMRGVMSQAMVLAASERVEGDAEKEKVELVAPPPGAKPGDKVYVSGFEAVAPEPLLPPKKKIFEAVQPGYTTLPDLSVAWSKPETEGAPKQGLFVRVDGAEVPCKVPSLLGATVR